MGFLVTLIASRITESDRDRGELGLTHPIMSSRLWLNVALGASAIVLSPSVVALSLGAEQVMSTLGQPLRLVIPLLGETASSLETRCFRLVPPTRSDGLFVVTQARIELQTTTTPPQLIIRGNRPLDEPIIRISVEAGCDAPIRREYTLLLDPPGAATSERSAANLDPSPAQMVAPSVESTQSPTVAQSGSSAVTGRANSGDSTGREVNPSKLQTQAPATRNRAGVSAAPRSQPKSKPARPLPSASVAAAQAQRDQLQVLGAETGGGVGVDAAALAALAVPRLRVSSELLTLDPGSPTNPAAVDELQTAIANARRARLLAAPIDSDLSPRLEADLLVAQRRLAELQAQLTAAGLATKTESSAAGARAQSASASINASGWNWLSWVWIPGLLLVAGLIGFLLRQRRQEAPAQFDTKLHQSHDYGSDHELNLAEHTQRQQTVAATLGGEPSSSTSERSGNFPDTMPATAAASGAASTPRAAGASTPIIATRAEREASDRLNNPLFQLRDTESHVDVTELSQVTEEAQVYSDLGRNEQAIELLRDHIDTQTGDRLSPAPWLMIFELYRRTNNRVGYDELAPQFRKHFNGRVPDWENYGHELALDDGLEAFPHLVARIERDWGTPEARKFLEELLYDNRGGSRLGFSLAAYRDILLLLQVHEGLGSMPEFAATDWESRGANDSDGTPKWDISLEMIAPPRAGELESFLNRPPPDKF